MEETNVASDVPMDMSSDVSMDNTDAPALSGETGNISESSADKSVDLGSPDIPSEFLQGP